MAVQARTRMDGVREKPDSEAMTGISRSTLQRAKKKVEVQQ